MSISCESCRDGLWCRGCGSFDKIKALCRAGFSKNDAELIVDLQWGSCGYIAPCAVCKPDEFAKEFGVEFKKTT